MFYTIISFNRKYSNAEHKTGLVKSSHIISSEPSNYLKDSGNTKHCEFLKQAFSKMF